MATLTITIPAAAATRIAAACLALYPPPADVPVGTGAEKVAYVRTLLMQHLQNIVASHEANVAVEAARVAAATAETDLALT
jgi:hypothetical protein